MLEAKVGEIAEAIKGKVVSGDPETWVRGATVDSREVRGGEVFFALPGQRTDGHLFVSDALRRGASCAVVQRRTRARKGARILVEDTLRALLDLASWWRGKLGAKVVAVTGSVGKTTTKELVAAALGSRLEVAKSPGTYNTEIGLPLTLLSTGKGAEAIVVEMAMRGRGQIRQLCEVARPEVGIVTNVGSSHIGLLGSREEIARAKAELLEALPEWGTAILWCDSDVFDLLKSFVRSRLLTFGLGEGADFRLERFRSFGAEGLEMRALTPQGRVRVRLKLAGRHNALNALAALAAAHALGLPLREAAEAMSEVGPPPGRLNLREADGVLLLDDTYNASPESVAAALEVLTETEARRRAVCLGEMLELGEEAREAHLRAGRMVAEAKVDLFIAVGEEAGRWLRRGAVEGGMEKRKVKRAKTPEEAGEILRRWAREGDLILFKASRAVGMERALEVFAG